MKTKFYPIPGYEGKYSISEDGIVISHPKKYGFGFHKEKVLKKTTQNGYHCLRLGTGLSNFHYVHRLVALTFLEKPQDKNFVNHKDSNKINNHFSNLEWCTNLENTRHACHFGKNKHKVTSPEIVELIRKYKKEGFSYVYLAKLFKKCRSTITRIVKRQEFYNY